MTKIRRDRRAVVKQILRAAALGSPALLAAGPWLAPASGAGLSWDPGQTGATTGVSGGTGDWDDLSTFWFNPTTMLDQPWLDGSDATFAGNAGTVTLTTNHSAPTLTFATDGYVLNGPGTLTLTGDAVVNVSPIHNPPSLTGSATINAQINGPAAGTTGINMTGDGELVLTNSGNNWTGATIVTGGSFFGTLTVGANDALPTNASVRMKNQGGGLHTLKVPAGVSQQVPQITGLVAKGDFGRLAVDGTLIVGDANDFVNFSDLFGGTTGLYEKVGASLMQMKTSGTGSSYSGTVKISGGTMYMDPNGGFFGGLGTGGQNAVPSNTLEFNGGTFEVNGNGIFNGTVKVDAAGGTFDFTSYPTQGGTGYILVPAGTLGDGPLPTSWSGSIRSVTLNGDLTGNGNLVVTRRWDGGNVPSSEVRYNSGLFLNGDTPASAKSFTGTIVVKGAGVLLDSDNSAPNITGIVLDPAPAGSLQQSFLSIHNFMTFSKPITISPNTIARIQTTSTNQAQGTATPAPAGSGSGWTFAGGIVASNLVIPSTSRLVLGTNDAQNNNETSTNARPLTFSGAISGSGELSRGGPGIVGSYTEVQRDRGVIILTGDNSGFTGPVTIYRQGVLLVSASNNLGSGSGDNSNITMDLGGILRTGGSFSNTRSIVSGNSQSRNNNTATGALSGNAGATIDSVNNITGIGFDTSWGDVVKLGSASSGVFNKQGTAGTVTVARINPAHAAFAVNVTGGKLAIAPGASPASVVGALSITNTGSQLDLTNDQLVSTAAVGTLGTGNTYTGVTGLIQAGRNGGAWNGTGIVTSQTDATTSNFTSIGVATAQQVKGLATATDTAVWAGQTVTGSETLVMYTYGGDANLDGKINVDDYGHIDSSIGIGLNGWFNGDFNYDGKINVDDYGIIDFNIGIQGAPFPTGAGTTSGGLTAVPEPGSIGLLGVVATSFIGRRRRK